MEKATLFRGLRTSREKSDPGWVKTELGGEGAMMDITSGAKTGVELAILPNDGPSGGFFHLGEPVAW